MHKKVDENYVISLTDEEVARICHENGLMFGSRAFGLHNEHSDIDFYLPASSAHTLDEIFGIAYDAGITSSTEIREMIFTDAHGTIITTSNPYSVNTLRNYDSVKITYPGHPTINILRVETLEPYRNVDKMYRSMLESSFIHDMAKDDKDFRHRLYEFCILREFGEVEIELEDDIPF